MPRSRKRHHSRSRSKTRSRSPSRDTCHEKPKKPSSNEKDGKRRRLDEIVDSPVQKRSVSADDITTSNDRIEEVQVKDAIDTMPSDSKCKGADLNPADVSNKVACSDKKTTNDIAVNGKSSDDERSEGFHKSEEGERKKDTSVSTSQSSGTTIQMEVVYDKTDKIVTPKKALTPKQVQKLHESEKKKQLRQKEKEEREKQKLDEKAKILAEKQKLKEQKEAEKQKLLEEKQRQLELRQKEKEMKDEQKRKEREEKEQKRKEKEEQEAQKRKEKEEERLKKLQEMEEKNKEKQKEEEKKQKTAALFKNFFKKTENEGKDSKNESFISNFMPFEVKSDMRLPPPRRPSLSEEQSRRLDFFLENQDDQASYLYDLRNNEIIPGKCCKTWPHEEVDEDVTVIGDDKVLGETICEDKTVLHKMKVKFLLFNENRRPAYRGTWRKRTKCIKPRRPFGKDIDQFNYEEDSDDDWEQEEQGESLEVSGDEEEKETDNDDEYDIDNDFFVPHGHLSDDEIDDEENARLSPESLKQKLKLLKDEFDEDIKSKTHKLKPRSIGVIWYNETGNNIDDAIHKYLQPFAMILDGQIEIKKRSDIFGSPSDRKRTKASKTTVELPIEHIPHFLKIIHGNANKKKTVIEEFLTFMANNEITVEVSKANLLRFLKCSATYRRCKDNGPMKNKFGWFVNDGVKDKYNVNLELSKG